jgi:hypothetical protein
MPAAAAADGSGGQQQQQPGGGAAAGSADNSGGPGGAAAGGPLSIPMGGQQQQQQQQQPGAGQQQQQQQPAAGAIYRPDGLPDHLLGTSEKETIDKLWKSTKGFMDSQATRGAVPEKPDGYQLGTLPEAVAKKLGDLKDDPVIPMLRGAAHAAGITDKAFSTFMPKILEALDQAGMVPDQSAFDPDTQIGELEKDHQTIQDPRERRAIAAKRITETKSRLDNLLKAEVLDKGEHAELLSLLPTTKTFRLLEKIVGKFTQADGTVSPGAGGSQSGGVSEADITARRMDPRYDSRSTKYDAAFRNETDRLWQDFTNKRGPRAA